MIDTFYRIWDTDTKTWFRTDRGKTIWTGSNHAKNAWNTAQAYRRYTNRGKFNEQDRFQLVPVKLVPEKDYESMLEDLDWLQCLESAGVDNWQGIDFAFELAQEAIQ